MKNFKRFETQFMTSLLEFQDGITTYRLHYLKSHTFFIPEGLQECKYASCSYSQWSEWSAECGKINRTREMVTEKMTSWRANCRGLETDCSKHTETFQEKSETCKYFEIDI